MILVKERPRSIELVNYRQYGVDYTEVEALREPEDHPLYMLFPVLKSTSYFDGVEDGVETARRCYEAVGYEMVEVHEVAPPYEGMKPSLGLFRAREEHACRRRG